MDGKWLLALAMATLLTLMGGANLPALADPESAGTVSPSANLVAVDGTTDPGVTKSKIVRGLFGHVRVYVGNEDPYTLVSPSGASIGTESPVSENVSFWSVNLTSGWWALKKLDGSVKTSFEVVYNGTLDMNLIRS